MQHSKTSPPCLIKYGGNAMTNPALMQEVAQTLAQWTQPPIIVHGGGPFIAQALKEHNISLPFAEGHRVTTEEAMPIIEQALMQRVNRPLVQALNHAGLRSIGLNGLDAHSIKANFRKLAKQNGKSLSLGRVGDVSQVQADWIFPLLEQGICPVFACIGLAPDGKACNINGDLFAAHLAAALKVHRLVLLTDVKGVYRNFPDPESFCSHLSLQEVDSMLQSPDLAGGMRPKLEAVQCAIKLGVPEVHIMDGTKSELLHQLNQTPPPGTCIQHTS